MSKRGYDGHEADLAEMFGLRRTVTSGNKFYDPGDCVSGDHDAVFPIFVDCKYTEKRSHLITLDTLEVCRDHAASLGKRLCLGLRYWHKDAARPTDFVVLSAHDFAELLDMASP